MKFLLIFIGYVLGINFPDIDQKIKFLGHRSFLTHSPIITLILYYFSRRSNMQEFNYILFGFSFAIGIHLIFDLFPKGWVGGSIIKPFGGILFSKIYIFLSLLISFWFSIKVTTDIKIYLLLSLAGIFGLFIYSKKEKILLRPIALYFSIIVFLGIFCFEGFIDYIIQHFQAFIKLIKL